LSNAAATNGARRCSTPSSPPINGPAMKPMPIIAPSWPKRRARSGSAVTSVTYAVATATFAPVIPAISRPT